MKRSIVLAVAGIAVSGAALVAVAARPSAETAAETAAAVAERADAPTYKVDNVHSSVVFRIKHAGIANIYGRFNELDGTFTFDPESPESGSFEFVVKNQSVDTGHEGRDNHLRNPDFFNARQFPETTFKSTGIERVSADRFRLIGDLTLHGATREVAADLEWFGAGEHQGHPIAAFEAVLDIRRSDFGMTRFLPPDHSDDGGIGNHVHLVIAVEARKQ